MGYCTTYKLVWTPQGKGETFKPCSHNPPADASFCPKCGVALTPLSLNDVIARAITAAQRKDADFMYGVCSDGTPSESCKWYDHEKEMRAFSKQFPNVLFTLEGQGEEAGDLWQKYFLNGKMQTAKAVISFEMFDPAKLS
jgi:hypothetical protein